LLLALIFGNTAYSASEVPKALPALKMSDSPKIDGNLDDACWQNAPKATDFTDPLLGTLAKDQTIAQLLYDEKAIYVAIYAFDLHPDMIVAQQTKDQTRFYGEDYVAFGIDPFHTHQFADRNFFIVNPLSAKFAHLAAGRAEKTEWIGLWKAAAKITEDGWTVEMEIPWQMLAYPDAKEPITMGINFDRFQQRTGEKSWWSNVGIQEFYEYDGHWVGVLPPVKAREMKFLPYAYFGRSPASSREDITARAGMDVRYAFIPQFTFVGTLNPDFENVEQAVEGIDFSYGARFVPDRRPFFLEGRNIFNLWEFYYSRQISEMDAGISLFGKVGNRTSAGALGAFHRGGNHNLLLRTSHSLSATTNIGAAYIGHRDDSGMNSVGFLEGEKRFRVFSVGANFAQTWYGKQIGRQMRSNVAYRGSRFSVSIAPFFIEPEFVNKLGFHPFTGIRGGKISVFGQNEWRSGVLRLIQLFTMGEVSDRYDGAIFRRTAEMGVGLLTRSDYNLSFVCDGGRFEEYWDKTFTIIFRGRFSDQFTNYGIDYSWGRRVDKPYRSLRASASLRAGALTIGLTLHFVQHQERNQQHIVTLNYDFTPALSLGGRFIWQGSNDNPLTPVAEVAKLLGKGEGNVYFALRRSGYAGTDIYVIVGDPNAEKFQRRLVGKVVRAF
jgi:hypothetical protein